MTLEELEDTLQEEFTSHALDYFSDFPAVCDERLAERLVELQKWIGTVNHYRICFEAIKANPDQARQILEEDFEEFSEAAQ